MKLKLTPLSMGFVCLVVSGLGSCCIYNQANAQLVRTAYAPISSISSGNCIDSLAESTAPGTISVEAPCNFNASNHSIFWTLRPTSKGFQIINQRNNALCLSISGASTQAGATVEQDTCTRASNQLWTVATSGSAYQLTNVNSGMCLIEGAPLQGTTALSQGACSPATSSNSWAFGNGGLAMPATPVNLLATHSGQCLNNQASSSTGTTIVQDPCAGAAGVSAEQWFLQPSGTSYKVVSAGSGLCLSGVTAVATAGAAIVQATCSATAANQLWVARPTGGVYELHTPGSSFQCMTVNGANQAAATPLLEEPCAQAQDQLFAINIANVPSQWSAVITLPVIPVGAANLPNGKLLTWSSWKQAGFTPSDQGTTPSQTYTSIFDPDTLTSVQVLETSALTDLFCPGSAQLFDGRILLNGGSSSYATSIYDPVANAWVNDSLMNIPRGYEGSTILTNGSVFTLGGSFDGGIGGKTGEVWTEGLGWTLLPNVPEDPIVGPDPKGTWRGDNHGWFFAMGGGQVFHAGPSAEMHWITTAAGGSIVSMGDRADDPYSVNGKAVMYDTGSILKFGGAQAYDDGPATASTYNLQLNSVDTNAGVVVTKLAPMAYPRAFVNGVVLPDGEVIAIGGQTKVEKFSDDYAVLTPEIWDPVTKVFRQLAPMQTARNYHGVSILMKDGRVFSGGGGLCGTGCAGNHFNAELFSPPYLFNADGTAATRPVINTASASALLGGTITVATDSPVTQFALMRFSVVTHSVNADQRRIVLPIASETTPKNYVLNVPLDPAVVMPGNYMLFALNAQGVPSVAQVVQVLP